MSGTAFSFGNGVDATGAYAFEVRPCTAQSIIENIPALLTNPAVFDHSVADIQTIFDLILQSVFHPSTSVKCFEGSDQVAKKDAALLLN